MTLETGIRGEQSVPVTAENTAKTMGSGTLDVFATPALVALAEKTWSTCFTDNRRNVSPYQIVYRNRILIYYA